MKPTRLQKRKTLWRAARGEGRFDLVWPLGLAVRVRGVNVDYSVFRAFCAARSIAMPRQFTSRFSMETRVFRISYPDPDPSLWMRLR